MATDEGTISPRPPVGPTTRSVPVTVAAARREEARPQVALLEAAAPTIQVTIGRLEVRAHLTTAPPPQRRTTPAVMSLEDYLRQRRQGGAG